MPRAATAIATVLAAALAAADARAEDAPAPAPKLTRAPKLKKFVQPAYPESAKAEARPAVVVLTLELSAQGKVLSAAPTTPGDPEFDSAAVAAALQLEFEPAEIDGKPAPVRLGFRFRFTVEVQAPEPPKTVDLEGTVVDRAGGAPLEGVAVELPALGKSEVTDARGAFRFQALPRGVYALRLALKGYLSTSQEVALDRSLSLTLQLERRQRAKDVDEEVVVRVPRVRREVGATAIATSEARHLPGAMGDALAVVQNLPGVARASAGSGAVVVWGSAPAETRIVVDDIPVPYLYHRGGLRSVLNDALVASVELVPGGFGADQGRATGGLVRVTTSPLPKEGFSGAVGVDLIDGQASLGYRQPAAAGPHAVAVGGRYGWLSRLLPLVVRGIEQTVPLPEYFDYVGKWVVRGAGEANTQVLVFGAADTVDRFFLGGGDQRVETQFHRASVRHQQPLASGATTDFGLWVGLDRSFTRDTFEKASASQELFGLRGGVRASLKQVFTPNVSLTLGADVEASRTQAERVGTLGLPPREGDMVVFGQPPGDQVAFERWTNHSVAAAAFAELELSVADRLVVRPGFRFEPSVLEGDRKLPRSGAAIDIGYTRFEPLLEPRLAAQLKVVPQLSFNAAAGLYHQTPDPADLSSVFGNTSLKSSSGFHAVLGTTVKPIPQLSIEATGFYKSTWGLATRSPLDAPRVAQALVDTGEGRSFGAQVVVKPNAWKWLSGWASYSLIRSERRSGPDAQWRLFDYDQTHLLVVVASVELPLGFQVGARFRLSTGYPRTPVTAAFFDSRTNVYQPVRGEQNAERLPAFVQLDARAEKVFKWPGASLSIYLDVLNVTNTPNPEEVTYSFDYQDKKYLTGLPFLAVLGARLEW